jgi:3-hydroxymyristoyl/3-hydroxydecanoyl-(acyl carrier protein) dehydratase
MDEHCSAARVPADHPCLAGHFPGDPIVPGVVLLELVEQAARDRFGAQLRVVRFPNVKFLSPLRPDEVMRIVLQGSAAQLRFSCHCDTRLLAQGSLQMAL